MKYFRFPLFCFLVSFWPLQAIAFEVGFASPDADEDLSEQLRGASLVLGLQANEDTADVTGQEILAAARADYTRLTGVLYDAGYFGPVISIRIDGEEAASIPVVRAPERVGRVQINVAPGPAFRFGRARIAPLARDTELPPDFAPGKRASTSVSRDAVGAAITGWRLRGHATAQPQNQSIIVRHAARELDVDVQIDPGPRLRFGRLVLSGDSKVRASRLRSIAGLPVGDVFSPVELERASKRLQRTGTFRVVSLNEGEPQPDGTLPIEATIIDRKPRTLGFGAELSSLEGVKLTGYWLHRNLFGGAERLRLDGVVEGIAGESGGINYSLGAYYVRPATRGADTDFFADFVLERLDEENFASDRVETAVGFINQNREDRTFTYGVGLEYARTDDAFGKNEYLLFTLPLSAEADERDNKLDARSGWFAFLDLKPFAALKGTSSGVRSALDLRYFQPLGGRVVLAARGQVGSIFGPSLEDAPADYLFYSGGGGTVRGQSYQSLGIDLDNGETVGGRSFLGVSGEVRVRTGKNLSVVGFVDAGYIGRETFPDATSGEWHSGAGVGVRYSTGVGPIRFDVATPTGGSGKSGDFEIYIGIGQAF